MAESAIAIRGPLIKSAIFATVTSVVLVFISIELGGFRFGDTTSYRAVFTNSSELLDGDSVMVNGVQVGSVSSIGLRDNTQAEVTFNVSDSVKLREDVKAVVRYKNLTGDRYLELVPHGTSAAVLRDGATIPIAQTRPALDLDVLLGGLQPLFEGLDAKQINQLSAELVSVLQGQGGTVESILKRVASFTSTLAEKDEVIGQTIDNLNSVLGNLDSHSVELGETITGLNKVATGLAKQRKQLGNSVSDAGTLVASINRLLVQLRGPFKGMVTELGRTVTQVNKGSKSVEQLLRELPGDYLRIGRVASRGPGYNLYFCSLRVKLTGGNGKPIYTPWIGPAPNVERCKFGTAPIETPEEREAAEKANDEKNGAMTDE